MRSVELAQLNIARALAPLDDARMDGFVERLGEINGLAEHTPGFVWRLTDKLGADATGIRAYADPLIIVNLTVWTGIDELHDFAYRSTHVEMLRARRDWFAPFDGSVARAVVGAGRRPPHDRGGGRAPGAPRRARPHGARVHAQAALRPGLDRDPTRAGGRRRRVTRLGVAACLVAVLLGMVSGCAGGAAGSSNAVSGTSSASGGAAPVTVAFHGRGLTLDRPASWSEFHYQVVSSFTDVIAYLGNTDVHDPCTRSANELSCGWGFSLPPGGIVVVVEQDGFPMFDILDPAQAERGALGEVAGLPARRALTGPDPGAQADAVLTWTVSDPGLVDNYFTITACARNPGALDLLAGVDAMVKNLRYDTPVVPLPKDPAAIRAAVGAAIDNLARGSVGWDCVPRGPGVAHAMITAIPNGPTLPAPAQATCTVTVEPTAHQLWEGHHHRGADGTVATNAGDGSLVVWVAPDPNPAPSPSP